MATISIQQVYDLLSQHLGLSDSLSMVDAMRFIRLTAALKKTIVHTAGSDCELHPPASLPDIVREFLKNAMQMNEDQVNGCWEALQGIAWDYSVDEHSSNADAQLFYKYGREDHLSTSIET